MSKSNLLSDERKIGFVGGGNMAFAIGAGLVERGCITAKDIFTSGPNLDHLTRWVDMGVFVTRDNSEVVRKADVVFICVKPNKLKVCAEQIKASTQSSEVESLQKKLFVSVLAGVTLDSLKAHFFFIPNIKMVRCMPNTPLQVGCGCTVFANTATVSKEDAAYINSLFNALGIGEQVAESLIDAVSGLSGCGPAFVYIIMEAMADAAVKIGVPRSMSINFAAQTMLGAAQTVLVTGKHMAILKDEVCSPGGATIAGVYEIEKGNTRATIMNAITASYKRCTELGRDS